MQLVRMSFAASIAVILLQAPLAHAHGGLPAQYHVQDLGVDITTAAVNADGVVAGQNSNMQPRLWSDGQHVRLSHAKATAIALGVNHAGVAVGQAVSKDERRASALKWTSPDVYENVGEGLPSHFNSAVGINDAGDCIILSAGVESRSYLSAGCTAGNAVDLGTLGGTNTWASAINASGQIAGSSNSNEARPERAFLYSNGTMQNLGVLPNDSWSSGTGLNDAGHVVGFSVDDAFVHKAFFYKDGTMTAVGTLGGAQSEAFAVNGSDIVVGWAQQSNSAQQAFVRDMSTDGNPILNLQDLLDDSGAGWNLVEALAINDAGQILVYAFVGDPQVVHAALLVPVQ